MRIYRFFCLLKLAYKIVLRSYGLNSNPTSEDDENSDIELMEVSIISMNCILATFHLQ